MNLTEQYRAKTFAFVAPPSEGSITGWKGHALRITVLAMGFGIYVLFFRRKNSSGGKWSLRGSRSVPAAGNDDDSSSGAKEPRSNDDGPTVPYNDEVCPICLGAPKIGVKAPCGHLLCADCLASYCDVRIAPAPPPCPLCRAPLNSVALACDFVGTAHRDCWAPILNVYRTLDTPVRFSNCGHSHCTLDTGNKQDLKGALDVRYTWKEGHGIRGRFAFLSSHKRDFSYEYIMTILSHKMLDSNTIMVQDWIREYNNHRGLMTQRRAFLTTRFIFFFNILTLFLLIGLIATRLQVLAEV